MVTVLAKLKEAKVQNVLLKKKDGFLLSVYVLLKHPR